MVDESKEERGYASLEAISPSDGRTCLVRVSSELIAEVARRGPMHAKQLAYLVPFTLTNPKAIFEGLRREDDEDRGRRSGSGRYAYCGMPNQAFDRDGARVPVKAGRVFLVFVNYDNEVYNWRWEKCDASNSHLPVGYEDRFKARVL